MATKLRINQLPADVAERARNAFTGVVNDLDHLLVSLGDRLGAGPMPRRDEMLRIVRSVRKSLDSRLAGLEKAIQGRKPAAKKKPAKKAAKAAKKSVKKAAKKAAKKKPATKAAKQAPRKAAKKVAKKVSKGARKGTQRKK